MNESVTLVKRRSAATDRAGNRNSGSPTIRDIAKIAGVSAAAVSKALNRKPDISEKLRKRIFQICDSLDYRIKPNIQDLARNADKHTTHNIALVIVDMMFSDPAYAKVTDGIFAAAEQQELNLILARMSGEEEHIYDLSPILRERRIDGILVTGQVTYSAVALLKKLGIPYVILGTYGDDVVGSSVNVLVDMRVCIAGMVAKLQKLGKSRIAYVLTERKNHFQQAMLNAFRKALPQLGLVFNEHLVYYLESPKAGLSFPALTKIFRQEELPFDSVVTTNFGLAMEMSHLAMARAGVGEELEIAIATLRNSVFDRLPCSAIYGETDFDRVAYEGVKVLVDIINGKTEMRPRQITLNP